ncbi:MAG: type 4a pilus biogenesis protein PilO [bacterium]|nr:type 4a pilus biogenesis protein PilO [bacterium]
MKPSSKRSLSLLASAVLLIGALVFYANFIKSEYDDVQRLRGNLEAKKELFEKQRDIIERVKMLLETYKGSTRLQETISLALPAYEDTASLFQQVFAITQSSGLRMQSFNLSKTPPRGDKLGLIKLNLTFRGSYSALKSLTQSLETNIRVMDISSLDIRGDLYNLSIDTYYQ